MFKPEVTVATIVKKNDKYLMVEEKINEKIKLNQPAGHLEQNETIQNAAIRETYEETGYLVELNSLIGIYTWKMTKSYFIRFTFFAEIINFDDKAKLDKGIIRTHWLSSEEIYSAAEKLRSPIILKSIADFESGVYFSDEIIKTC